MKQLYGNLSIASFPPCCASVAVCWHCPTVCCWVHTPQFFHSAMMDGHPDGAQFGGCEHPGACFLHTQVYVSLGHTTCMASVYLHLWEHRCVCFPASSACRSQGLHVLARAEQHWNLFVILSISVSKSLMTPRPQSASSRASETPPNPAPSMYYTSEPRSFHMLCRPRQKGGLDIWELSPHWWPKWTSVLFGWLLIGTSSKCVEVTWGYWHLVCALSH